VRAREKKMTTDAAYLNVLATLSAAQKLVSWPSLTILIYQYARRVERTTGVHSNPRLSAPVYTGVVDLRASFLEGAYDILKKIKLPDGAPVELVDGLKMLRLEVRDQYIYVDKSERKARLVTDMSNEFDAIDREMYDAEVDDTDDELKSECLLCSEEEDEEKEEKGKGHGDDGVIAKKKKKSA